MNRAEKLESYFSHPHLKKKISSLKASELSLAREFIEKNRDLNQSDFELKTNRFFLDDPNKPKNWVTICELLSCCNAREVL